MLKLDTSGMPEGTFISEMDALEVFADAELTGTTQGKTLHGLLNRRSTSWNFGEYLSQGELDIRGRCAQTTMRRLIDVGFFKLLPQLTDKALWQGLAISANKLRALIWPSADAIPTTHAEVRGGGPSPSQISASAIAGLFR